MLARLLAVHATRFLRSLVVLPIDPMQSSASRACCAACCGCAVGVALLAASYVAYVRPRSQQMRRAQQMAIDFINLERGGITAGGKKYGVHAFWMDDQSSKQLVTNATAHAGRGWGADFMLGGYSSGVTTYTTKQSYADGYILVAPGAASTSVFT